MQDVHNKKIRIVGLLVMYLNVVTDDHCRKSGTRKFVLQTQIPADRYLYGCVNLPCSKVRFLRERQAEAGHVCSKQCIYKGVQ